MAPPIDGLEQHPLMLVLTDRELNVRAVVGPPAVTRALRAAKSAGTAIDRLAWAPHKPMQTAFTTARSGKRKAVAWQIEGIAFEGYVVPLHDDEGQVAGVALAGVNALSAGDRAELHDLRLALRQTQEAASAAYYVVDLATDTVTVTPAFSRIWGFPEETREVAFATVFERIHPDDRPAFLAGRSDAIAASGPLSLEFRVRNGAETRHVRVLGGFFTDAVGRAQRSVGTVVDITEHVQAERAVSFLSKRDPLTGLLNRHVLLQLLAERTGDEHDVALLVLDIDRFAAINEIAGHVIGDRLLRSVGDRLSKLERHGHAVARLGGDEFAALLVAKDRDDAHAIAQGVAASLRAPYEIDESDYLLRITAGLACAPGDGTGDALLHNANMALLAAKATSPGGIGSYDPTMEGRLSVRSRLERDLAGALGRAQFEMFYQPVICAVSGRVSAAEALLRWYHPELGLLSPDVFLAIAEESDLVVEIGRWAIERACRDAVHMRRALSRDLRMNVNVSPRHVQSSVLVDDVCAALERTGWHPGQLQLEVTEQMLIADMSRAATTLSALRTHGVTIAIDDFGTGYNTLSYLKSYPITCIKIDRAFVRDAESDDYSRAICRTVKTLAESLRLHLIGEGVETPAQAQFLRTIGCDELQGFHFGVPAPLEEFLATYAA